MSAASIAGDEDPATEVVAIVQGKSCGFLFAEAGM